MRTRLLAFLALAIAGHASADDIFVPGDFATIREAGFVAREGDSIIVSPGTYGGFILFGSTVRSSTGNRADVVVTGLANILALGRLESMTLTGGVKISNGGDISDCLIDGESLMIDASSGGVTTIDASRFQNCDDGAIDMQSGPHSTSITDTEFVNNANLNGDGGAIRMSGEGFLTVTGCTFLDNAAADDGGALYLDASQIIVTVLESTFINNGAQNEAGGIYFAASGNPGGDLVIDTCEFLGNISGGEASAVYVQTEDDVSAQILSSSFRNNAAGSLGGAIAGVPFGPDPQFLSVVASDFCGNTPTDIRGVFTQAHNTFAAACPDGCIADTNGDGVLSPADFNGWILAFNNDTPECDQNGDGQCTPADFNGWILNFNAGCP